MKNQIFKLLLLLFYTTSFYSQNFSIDLLKDINPRNIGPAGMSGRVTAIDVVITNTDIIYAVTASGVLWKSE